MLCWLNVCFVVYLTAKTGISKRYYSFSYCETIRRSTRYSVWIFFNINDNQSASRLQFLTMDALLLCRRSDESPFTDNMENCCRRLTSVNCPVLKTSALLGINFTSQTVPTMNLLYTRKNNFS
jgi:hypothetical protein